MSRYSRGFPQLLSHLSHCAGDQEQRRQDKDGSLHCQARVRHGVKETQSYISTVSLFPDGQPFQPIGLVMTPNLDDKEITQDNKPPVTLPHMC